LANPFDCAASSRYLHRNAFTRTLYSKRLAQGLSRLFRSFQHVFKDSDYIDSTALDHIRSVRDFDEVLTRRSFGYPTVDSYYHDASSSKWILGIRIPFLCLSALDDPICWSGCIPYDECL
jgi:predicted alpha/beta-fold hydrolase